MPWSLTAAFASPQRLAASCVEGNACIPIFRPTHISTYESGSGMLEGMDADVGAGNRAGSTGGVQDRRPHGDEESSS